MTPDSNVIRFPVERRGVPPRKISELLATKPTHDDMAALAMRACDLIAESRTAPPVERVKLFELSKAALNGYIEMREELNKEDK